MKRFASLMLVAACTLAMATGWIGCANNNSSAVPAVAQQTFASPEDATVTLIDIARTGDVDLLVPLFGTAISDLSANTKDRTSADLQRLAAAYDLNHSLVKEDDGSVTLVVGKLDWEFPAPLVEENGRWRFDAVAGANEIRARRIFRNEVDAQATLMGLVAGQKQFFAMSAARGEATPTFASRIGSTPGKRDGLYWDDDMGAPTSPLGPMVEAAFESGDLKDLPAAGSQGPQPYRGYKFRVLSRQGAGAPGGAKSYLDGSGKMTGGFAFIAWPAEYGDSGVMTFQVGADGSIFAKDLSDDTESAAKAIETFDPSGWEPALQ